MIAITHKSPRVAQLESWRRLLSSVMILSLVFALLPSPAPQAPDTLEQQLEAVRHERAIDPENPDSLAALAELLGQADDEDGELAYTLYALDAYEALEMDDEKAKESLLKGLDKRLKKLDSSVHRLGSNRDSYVNDLIWVLRLYADNQKKHRNALDIAGRILRYRPSHRITRLTVAAILEDADRELELEAQRLLGVQELRRSLTYRRAWLEDHGTWGSAGNVETSGYKVTSNIGYDTLNRAASALERISDFYHEFYGVGFDERPKTKVFLCRTREEFERISSDPRMAENPGVKGYIQFMSGGDRKFQVYSYDPRSDGLPLGDLFETLFHEASHQYMVLAVGQNDAPQWLHEGMASYFEGVELGEEGELRVGLPAMGRLQLLYQMLQNDQGALSETLNATDLNGAQYSVAWGLIYYLYHHQDDSGDYPYRETLRGAIELAGSRQVGGAELFQEACLAKIGLSLEDFEAQWIDAMLKLGELEADRAAAAVHHRERAHAFLAAGKTDAAREAFQATLLRSPSDIESQLGLARLTAGGKDRADKDDTLLWSRRAHRNATTEGLDELVNEALAMAHESDPAGFKKVLKAEDKYRERVLRQVDKLIEAGSPKSALAVVRIYLDSVLGENHHDAIAEQLRTSGAYDMRRTRLVSGGSSMEGLSVSPNYFSISEGEIVAQVPRPDRGPMLVTEAVSLRSRFEGEIKLVDCDVIVSFLVSQSSAEGEVGFSVRPVVHAPCAMATRSSGYVPFDFLRHGQIGLLKEGFDERFQIFDYKINGAKEMEATVETGKWASFALDCLEPGVIKLEIDGVLVGQQELAKDNQSIQPGLLIFGGEARMRNLRIVELDRP